MIITIDTGQTFPFSWPKLRQLSTREKKCQKGQKLTDQLSFPKIPIPSSVYVIETILSCSFRLSSEDKQARYCNSASPNLTLTDKLNLLLDGGHSDTNIIQQNLLLLLLPLSLSLCNRLLALRSRVVSAILSQCLFAVLRSQIH